MWTFLSLLISLIVLAPLTIVGANVFRDSNGVWRHLIETRLVEYASNSLVLVAGVLLLTLSIGVPTGWVLARFRFPGSRVLGWAMLLPIAMPAYVTAYALTDLLQFSGPVQSWYRDVAPWAGPKSRLIEMRSLPGACLILGLSLYPYVYYAARLAFMSQTGALLESARTLGDSRWRGFLRIELPLARYAIAGGLLLVAMETLADFAAVEYCAVDTLATGVYRTWLGMNSIVGAAQLSVVLLAFTMLVAGGEWFIRRKRVYSVTGVRGAHAYRKALTGWPACLAIMLCLFPIVIGVGIPIARLAYLAGRSGDARFLELIVDHGANTLMVAAPAAVLATAFAGLLASARRFSPNALTRLATTISRLGYGMPGPVVAIGVLILAGTLDHAIDDAARAAGLDRPGLILSSSIAILTLGYLTRFLAPAYTYVSSSMNGVDPALEQASLTLGRGTITTMLRVHAPLTRAGLLAALTIVFVDVAQELPATLMLRPFNFDTLAVRVYQLASDERLEEAASGALALVALGVLPVIVLVQRLDACDQLARSTPERGGRR